MRRLALLITLGGLVMTGCDSPLGQKVPECDEPTNSLILSVQAVPGVAYTPCIVALKTGWEYEWLQAESGQSIFHLDSDRLGARFIKVSLVPFCDTSGASEVESDEPGVPLYMDVDVSAGVPVTIVPEGRGLPTFAYAQQLQTELAEVEISDQAVTVQIDSGREDATKRIKTAKDAGHAVLVVSVRDAEDERATLILPGTDAELSGLKFHEVIDLLEDVAIPASYTGFWYYPFDGGCVIYTFDAHGAGVETIEAEVQIALSLYDVEPLRRLARELGRDPP